MVRLNDTPLSDALIAHENSFHSSVASDFHLIRSGQALIILLFHQLHVDCPMCHACEIRKSTPSPGGATNSKTSTDINRNSVQLGQAIASRNHDEKIRIYH